MLLWESAAQFSTEMTDMTFPSHTVDSTREINLNVGYGNTFGHRFKWYCKMATRGKISENSFD